MKSENGCTTTVKKKAVYNLYLPHMKTEHSEDEVNIPVTHKNLSPETEEGLKDRISSKHLSVNVKVLGSEPKDQSLSCCQCEYKCKFNIQLKHHIKRKHIQECKYQCSSCEFQSNLLIKIYEHKLNVHPDIPMDFHPKPINTKEFILNLLAEQNIDIL